jgi:hypothetical protein
VFRRHWALIVASLCPVLACHRATTVSAEHPASLIQPRGYWYWDSFEADTVRLLVGDSTWIKVLWTASTSDLLIPAEPPGKTVSPQWSTENSSVAGVRASDSEEACQSVEIRVQRYDAETRSSARSPVIAASVQDIHLVTRVRHL